MQDINVIAPINQLGYGVVGTNITKSLSKLAKISLWPIGSPEANNEDIDTLKQCMVNTNLPNFDSPCIRIWHQHDMSQFVGRGLKIGFPIFELDKFNEQEKHHLSYLDKIFVCSEWAKEVVAKEIGNKFKVYREDICVIPLGVDRSIFMEAPSHREETIFLNVGKWEVRKGHDVLVEAFNQAFKEDDNVELWMMCHNPFYDEKENNKWQGLYKNSKLGHKIRIIPRQQTQKEVYSIVAQSDCGVFPSRAEGWNLEALEMMSCGKKIITTDYSAHTEFCNNSNSLLIDINDKEDAFDGKWFKGQGRWAKLGQSEITTISDHMRDIHEQKQSGNSLFNKQGVKTAEKLSWENSANRILSSF